MLYRNGMGSDKYWPDIDKILDEQNAGEMLTCKGCLSDTWDECTLDLMLNVISCTDCPRKEDLN